MSDRIEHPGARLTMEALGDVPMARRRHEIVERKGIGHPDTICDRVVEAIAVALNRMYLDALGAIPHYNIDKALLIAGQCDKRFGAGGMRQPMEMIVGDRATFSVGGRALPVREVATEAAGGWIAAHVPAVRVGRELSVRLALAPGSEELAGIYAPAAPFVGSNDTCGASGYAPLTPTEQLVMDVERHANSRAFKAAFPDTGQDVKVFAVRTDAAVALTVAMPLSCLAVDSERGYFRRKDEILDALRRQFARAPFAVDWISTVSTPRAADRRARTSR